MDGLAARQDGQRDRVLLIALLAVVSLACWAYSVDMALKMAPGAAAGGMQAHHHHHHQDPGAESGPAWPPFLMWAVMMAGMMVPAEVPFFLRLLRLRQAAVAARPLVGPAALLAGYLGVWTLFSFGAALLQVALQARGLLDERLASTEPRLSALLLALAGAAQLLPFKRRCLERCHAPDPSLGAATPGAAAVAGAALGRVSLLSCGALMLVPFVVGAMDLLPMVLLTTILVAETLAPKRMRLSEVAGALLLCWAAFALTRMS